MYMISHIIISSSIGTPPTCTHKNSQSKHEHMVTFHCVSVNYLLISILVQMSDMNVFL